MPSPSYAACRDICEAAMPISIIGKWRRLITLPTLLLIFAPSSTITICTGACFVQWFMPNSLADVASAIWFFSSGSSTTINFHGCALQAEEQVWQLLSVLFFPALQEYLYMHVETVLLNNSSIYLFILYQFSYLYAS